jgi:hypothetical protein
MGRPLKPIDAEQVQRLATLGHTQAEIGQFFGVSRATISDRFLRDYQLGKLVRRKCLHQMQWKRCVAGSDAMLIHLGKTVLKQIDQIKHSGGVKVESEVLVIALPIKELHADDQAQPGPPDELSGE